MLARGVRDEVRTPQTATRDRRLQASPSRFLPSNRSTFPSSIFYTAPHRKPFEELYPLQGGQYFLRVAFGFHVIENLRDPAVFDDERRTRHPHHRLAVHVLFFHHPVLVRDLLFGVGETVM